MNLKKKKFQIKKDISNAIEQQIKSIRIREHELILELEQLVTTKEQKLWEQQQRLNQGIGNQYIKKKKNLAYFNKFQIIL